MQRSGGAKPDIERMLFEERVIGYLDPGAEAFLRSLNARGNLWTTSSCIGRIAVVEGRFHWERGGSRIVYKTHDPLSLEELLRVLARPFPDLWLKASGPIIHFQTPRLECALSLLETARNTGFKHSGIISGGQVYTIEVAAPTRIDAPLRVGRRDLYTIDGLAVLVEKANEALLEGRRRLERLARSVESLTSC